MLNNTNAIIASTSTIHGSAYLEYLLHTLSELYKDVSELVFIPFARPSGISHTNYTSKVKTALEALKITVFGLHEFEDKAKAIRNAEALFTGGGNTFQLVSQLYHYNLIEVLSNTIKKGTPYLGTSAGSNICGPSMRTTNDMPVVYPPSFDTLEILPFNINPHYLDPDLTSTHKGETRETRIKEFHIYNSTPVIGLREGSWLQVKKGECILKGDLTARVFEKDKTAYEVEPHTNFKTLLK